MSQTSVHRRTLILGLGLLASVVTCGQAATPNPANADSKFAVLAVSINGFRQSDGTVFVQSKSGRLFASAAFFAELNLKPSTESLMGENQVQYFDLDGVTGLRYSVDSSSGELSLLATADAFIANSLDIGAAPPLAIPPYTPGAFLNYELSTVHGGGANGSQGLFEAGAFAGKGLLTSSFTEGSAGGKRLMTTFRSDQVSALKSLQVGDSYNHTGAWGQGVLFGGIQYGTNFSVRPAFITTAMPTIAGRALLPSTVDVYVNQALRSRQSVNAGPFSIQNLPGITGNGELQIIVRDVLGREQMITQPFIASPSLLREGLVEQAYEAGWLRQNYGLQSNEYREPFLTATYRKGVNNALTAEARAEVQEGLATIGTSVAMALPAVGSVVEATAALSDERSLSTGTLIRGNYSYLGERWSFSAQMQWNSLRFRQLGSDVANLPRQLGSAQLSAPLGPGTMSINYLRRANQGQQLTRLFNFNYSQRLGERVFATLTVLKQMAVSGGVTASLGFTAVFGPRYFGAATMTRQTDGNTLYSEFQKLVPSDTGVGYRLADLYGTRNARQEVSVTGNSTFASLQTEFSRAAGTTSARATVRGGLMTLGDGVQFSRGNDESFAIVLTKDLKNVPIYLENTVVTHTDTRGRAVVSNLQPYQASRISIDPLTLPMDVSVSEVEKKVIPRARAGVLVDFELRTIHAAIVRVVFADGAPLTPWTTVSEIGTDRTFVSGLRGEIAVELSALKGNRLRLLPAGRAACEVIVDLPVSESLVPTIGPLTCVAVQ